MPRSAAVMTRVKPETKQRLASLAKATKRSEAFLANEAIEAYIETQAWQVEYIAEALAEHLADPDDVVPHEEVVVGLP